MISSLVRWGGSCLVVAGILATEVVAVNLFVPVVVAQTYQDTLNRKMAILKKSKERWIEVNLSTQRLTAWEGPKPVYAVIISTGKKDTPTIPGIFAIQSKRSIDRMKGEDYDIDDVPYAQYYSGGYAIHGAYWHKNFGTPVSHGCINLAVDHAKWLFEWSEVHTPLVIHP
ncbi:L,D-transpeptidase [Synechocystis sp. FACHB-383]|uniref:L,D-transpeptidase n=1 Tax=Synechocystis sp. FACHB-383 TaxID=2692864 RepID=UPI001684983C|nr:L,D-transpeptidase [Synechocystis sp. FACHB-383]MBD2654123.1 L,D-transpeptidase [Synechocystis sp. FACHB-383]